MESGWNPRPASRIEAARSAYYAGYSDRWHGACYGAGQEQPGNAYAAGWDHAGIDQHNRHTQNQQSKRDGLTA